jgi:hypothetical protein
MQPDLQPELTTTSSRASSLTVAFSALALLAAFALFSLAAAIGIASHTAPMLAQVATHQYASVAAAPFATGTPTVHGSGTTIDDQTYSVQLPFVVRTLNDAGFTDMTISANGWVSFGGVPSVGNQKFFNPLQSTGAGSVVAVLATDLQGNTANSRVQSFVTGTAPNRRFVVQWIDMRLFGGPVGASRLNFQLSITEASLTSFVFNYEGIVITPLISRTAQVGLRGASSADTRAFGGNWTNPLAAGTATSLMPLNSGSNPSSGFGFSLTRIVPAPTLFDATGRVLSGSTGQGLAGISMNCTSTNNAITGSRTAVTDANGRYTISGLPNGAYTVAANSTNVGFGANASQSFTVNNGLFTIPDIRSADGTITGTVTDSSGISAATLQRVVGPTNGAALVLTNVQTNAVRSATTGADGRYTFNDVRAGAYRLTVSRSGLSFTPSSRDITLSGGSSTVNFAGNTLVPPTYSVLGSIVGTNTPPSGLATGSFVNVSRGAVSGVAVSLAGTFSGKAPSPVVTGADGLFSFTGIPSGSYQVVASLAGATFPANRGGNTRQISVAGANVNVPFLSVETGAVEVVTRNAAMNPLSGVSVSIAGAGSAVSTVSGTASGGRALAGFYNLLPGTYTFSVLFPPATAGGQPRPALLASTSVQVSGNAITTLTLTDTPPPAPTSPGTLNVTVVNPTNNAPIVDATVLVTGNGVSQSLTSAKPAASFSLSPGTYTVSVQRSGFSFSASGTSTAVVTSGGTTAVNFNALFATITGSVTDPTNSNAIVADATITATPTGSAMAALLNLSYAGTSGTDGRYSISVPVGNYTMSGSRSGYGVDFANASVAANTANQSVQANATATPTQTATYSATGSVTSSVNAQVAAKSSGVQNVTMTISGSAGGAGSTSVLTNAQGSFQATGLRAGTYTVTPSRAGMTFSPASQSFTVPTINGGIPALAFSVQLFSIAGTVSVGGQPAQGVQISNGAGATATTDASGNYSFTGLSAGQYTLTPNFSNTNFTPATINATISATNLTAQNFAGAAIQAPSNAPTVTSPAANTTFSYNADGSGFPAYAFTGVSGAVAYGYQMSVNEAFTNAVASAYNTSNPRVPGPTFYQGAAITAQGTPFFFRIRAQFADGSFGAWSQVLRVVMQLPVVLASITPSNLSKGMTQTVTFVGTNTAFDQATAVRIANGSTTIAGTIGQRSATSLQVSFNVPATAPDGAYDLTIEGAVPISRTGALGIYAAVPANNVQAAFSPTTHGWNFRNSGSVVAPASYFAGFNYNTTQFAQASPSTLPRSITTYPNDVFSPWADYSVGYIAKLPNNGPAVLANGQLNPSIVSSWVGSTENGSLKWGGSCYGFAASAILAYSGIYANAPSSGVYNVALSDDARRLIHRHQSPQPGIFNGTTLQNLQTIRNGITSSDRRDLNILALTPDNASGGHAVVPYRISTGRRISDGVIIDSVFVYDMNHPGALDKAIIVEQDGQRGKWSYPSGGLNSDVTPGEPWRNNSGTGFFAMNNSKTEKAFTYTPRPVIARTQDDSDLDGVPDALIQIRFPALRSDRANATITTRVDGIGSILNNGKDPFGADNTLPGAQVFVPLTGSLDGPLDGVAGFNLAADGFAQFTTTYAPEQANTANFLTMTSGDRLSSRLSWVNADNVQAALATDIPNDKLTFASGGVSRSVELVVSKLDATKEISANSVVITSDRLNRCDTLTVQLQGDGTSVVVTRTACTQEPLNYTISFLQAANRSFQNQTILPGEVQTFVVENWNVLDRSGITLLRDTDNDGKVDQERQLAVSTSVRDAALPLADYGTQLFPNPASAALSVVFTLPSAGNAGAATIEDASVEVVNLLGQRVLSVPVSRNNAGSASAQQRIQLDVSSLAIGSYLVRVRTTSGVETKTLQVIR